MKRTWKSSLLLVATVMLLCVAFLPGDSTLGRALEPALGVGAGATVAGRAATGLILALLLLANGALIRLVPLKVQVLIVWVELLVLFLGFFYSFDLSFPFILSRLKYLIVQGAFTTIYVSLIAILIACAIALLAALARLSNSGPAYGVATFYISFFRGTPLLLQVYLIYLGLPQLGFIVDAIPAGITALSLCYGAYMAEIFRAGILGVPNGQREAAKAIGLRQGQIMRKIVLPQAMRLIVPPTGNQFIAMLKDSSLISVMGVWELMFLARTQGRAEFKHIEMLITAAIIYWIMSIVFELIQARLERYYGKGVTQHA